jgi:large subunit ribosomal protein L29
VRVHEMRDMAPEDLQASIVDTRKEIVELRFQLAARKLESPAKLRQARQRLSRLMTIQSEKARGASAGKTEKKPVAAKAAAAK